MKYALYSTIIALGFMLVSCGQYGDLYLPSHANGVKASVHHDQQKNKH